ncbi:MAG: hypothetical protein CMK09_01425 [Ponticaulis sp.]|nr:hypothetical protein [Ponticaulis sp.]
MSEEHDFGEEFYSAYAAGSLDPALTLLIETQASLKADVRKELLIADAVAGTFLESEAPAPMSFRAAERALEAIDALQAQPAIERKASRMASRMVDELIRLPEPLQEIALQNSVQSGWKYAGKGLRVLPIDVSADVTTELLRIEPGCGAPSHTHEGSEYTLVVSGGFTDEFGAYGPGDVSIVGSDHTHRPVADEGEICFALAVRDGNLKFDGLLGVLQKFFG